jgi:CelD/BcsL family acetyltransferase involved in cellulose biosynthesis
MFLTIDAAYRDGLEAFDLLGGDDPWKREWTDERVERRWLFLHRDTLPAQIVHSLKFVVAPRLRTARVAIPAAVRKLAEA